jgi:hypothetical protein
MEYQDRGTMAEQEPVRTVAAVEAQAQSVQMVAPAVEVLVALDQV